ncbi:MAG TPA: hypothetical protein VGF08_06640 [Terriglobales bacterium]|jgi:hypothetical protein
MSYWVPLLILGFVLLVLILQLPWHKPESRASRAEGLIQKTDLGIPEHPPATDSKMADVKSHSVGR